MATTPLQELIGAAEAVLQDLDATGLVRPGRRARLREAIRSIRATTPTPTPNEEK